MGRAQYLSALAFLFLVADKADGRTVPIRSVSDRLARDLCLKLGVIELNPAFTGELPTDDGGGDNREYLLTGTGQAFVDDGVTDLMSFAKGNQS